ncbi:aspartyl protease family protein [Spirosoma areae]
MNRFKFRLDDEDSLILVNSELDPDVLSLALDTGATNTIIDLSMLLIAGYEVKNAIKQVELETAKGPVQAYVFTIRRLPALGVTRNSMEVCGYDFFENGIVAEIDGV